MSKPRTLRSLAADQPSNIPGLFLTTKYPALTVRAGETSTLDLSLRNFRLPPQSLTVTVPEIASTLGVGYKTAANGCSLLKARLGVARTGDVIRLAMSLGVG